jgi:hypothetical protein
VAKNEQEFYKPAEACRMAEVAPYVLRYWETEFPALAEGKEKGAAKLYSSRDVKIIGRIREQGTIEGNKFLREVQKRATAAGMSPRVRQALDQAVMATAGGAQ